MWMQDGEISLRKSLKRIRKRKGAYVTCGVKCCGSDFFGDADEESNSDNMNERKNRDRH